MQNRKFEENICFNTREVPDKLLEQEPLLNSSE